MKKQLLFIVFVTQCAFLLNAQNDIDAMRYSQLTFGGTARFASMAGSMGALGGDISTLSFNPAGIGVFRKTELSLSPSIFSQSTSSTYNNNESSDSKLNFNFGNIGGVASINVHDKGTGWEFLNFGFGYNRTNNFHNRISIQGDNKTSSLLDTYVANANGHTSSDFDQFSTGLAWQAYLINPDTSGNLLYNHVIPHYGEVQKKSTETRGSMGETVISFGGNYQNVLFLGATVGFVNARYVEESVYQEVDQADTIKDFKSFSYTQSLTSKGSGMNLKLGAIYKPTDWLRIGAAIHTPTSISFTDNYSSTMKSNLESVTYDTSSPSGSYNYTVKTPLRALGSLGFVIGKYALFNIDYEYVDYKSALLSSSPNVFADVNKTIRSKYTSSNNLRLGGEVRFDPFSLRVGYALYGSPFAKEENKSASRTSYTGGLGFRQNNYFIDFAYVYTRYTEYSYLYDPSLVSSVKSTYQNMSFMLTLGTRF
jgi:long-subunit fatty acid transport protein